MTEQPLGYVYDASVIESNKQAFGAMGVDLSANPLKGACQRKIDAGIRYENLKDYEAEYLRDAGPRFLRTGRQITAGGTLAAISQMSGICVGAAYSAAQWLAWCARYALTGTGPIPQEVSLVAPYLLGRSNLRGDDGAYASHSALGSHDVGVLTVEGLCLIRGIAAPKMTTRQQEAIAIEMRDRPKLPGAWLDAMAHLRTRVFSPKSALEIANCIASGYPVTVGMGSQIVETTPSGDGVSGWYKLRGGHETVLDGTFVLNGRLGFLKSESWGDYPASKWPGKRVVLQTDGGSRQLYNGQGACWADDLMACKPELWAVGFAGSV